MDERPIYYPKEKKATSCRRRAEPGTDQSGVLYGWSNVLCSDGERRPVIVTDDEVKGMFLGNGYSRVYKTRVWDYNRNERVEVLGILRVTDEDDRIFQQLPDQEWQLPDWTIETLRGAYGRVTDAYGLADYGFVHFKVA